MIIESFSIFIKINKPTFRLNCILCTFPNSPPVLHDQSCKYYGCTNCGLYFVDPDNRLPKDEEKKRYDLHENDPADSRYREFLSQIYEPMAERLSPGKHGLDYGSGPGPTLHLMFEEMGFEMDIFDPFYQPDITVLERSYDFIVTTETAEHFYHPAEEFDRLWGLLNPGGMLGVMTKQLRDPSTFDSWHYRKDDTHVSFYQVKTFEWLSKKYGAILEIISERVILMHKPN